MARSGDWITPRLWGAPWFEKPALLYWMTATAYKMGFDDDLAPRFLVTLVAVAFLIFYYSILRQEFGERPAGYATLILASSVGWFAFSQLGVTDLPMAATVSAVILLCFKNGTRRSILAGALLGLAVLAKGLVPLVLAVPVVWKKRNPRELFLLGLVCLAVAGPWYALCTMRNGWPFLQELIIKQHFSRLVSDSIQHVQPPWFYLPVLLAGIFPWTPLLITLFDKKPYEDRRRVMLAAVVIFGILLFSIAKNKLPGYLLPLMPSLAALIGLRLAETQQTRIYLIATGFLAAVGITVGTGLPQLLSSGLSTVVPNWYEIVPILAAGVALAVLSDQLEVRGLRYAAIGAISVGFAAGALFLKMQVYPEVDRVASARGLARKLARRPVCVEDLNRNWRYGLNFYTVTPLPECAASDLPIHLTGGQKGPPRIVARPTQ
jgi:4-amino-4-deoxy-L-arabinose transferase-like glycosyltransferase